jgi:hypothetical protein
MKLKQSLLIATAIAFFALNAHAQNQTTVLQAEIVLLKAQVAALQHQVNLIAANPALAMGPFVTVDLAAENGVTGPNLVFHGVNVHVVSGSGNSFDNLISTGLGNLIIGYNEGGGVGSLGPLDRKGAHNLILGTYNKFTSSSYGGIVTGEANTLNGFQQVIAGGQGNTTNPAGSVIIGGVRNATIYGDDFKGSSNSQVIVGGEFNQLSGLESVILGGSANTINGNFTATLGQLLIPPEP